MKPTSATTEQPITSLENAFHIDPGTGEHVYPMTDPEKSGLKRFSHAYFEIEPGKSTTNHHHPKPYEELYHIIEGVGKMILDGSSYDVKANDAIAIKSDIKHKLINIGDGTLRAIVTCSPPWIESCVIADE